MNKLQNKNTSNGIKRAILIIASLFLFFAIAVSIRAATIVEDYPNLPACENNAQCNPGQTGFEFPQFIKYIYLFALGIVGIVGLLAIIIAAFDYVTSAGNPQKASGAKDKIISALLGLLLLLGSWVLLNLINPDLLKLKLEAPAVTVDITTEPPTTGCQYTQATLKPSTLDVTKGEWTITLTLKRDNCTVAEGDTHKVIIDLRQYAAGIFNPDPQYNEVVEGGGKVIKKTDTEWVFEMTFTVILNMQENEPEKFYLTGEIKIPNKPTQYIPRIDFTVIDGK